MVYERIVGTIGATLLAIPLMRIVSKYFTRGKF
jgi:hypothetical protein